ncbi:MAG: 16S rRNA (guanine(527)-N(7))-methyltransferase RsmG [Treponema sp.]|nr:16S rRNA (guanine(527)-N(7))-methyltransferase RsmG [Treponema sp.]
MNAETLLVKGINVLCENDKDFESLVAPRSEEIISLLERYKSEIELFNGAYGLVGTVDSNELVTRHILDSLAPLGIIHRLLGGGAAAAGRPKIADAGSGAGLPGVPLAIAMPNCDFTLIERMGRRAGFLCNTSAVLALSNITIEEGELEKTQKGRFNLITFRAFKPLDPKLLKTLLNACAKGGVIAAYKGRLEKTEQEMAPLENACQWEAIPYIVPFLEEERHLLIIRTCHE